MTIHVPTPKPTVKQDWMKEPNLAFYSSASSTPLDMAYCAPGGSTSEIRTSWAPKFEGDTGYSPDGMKYCEWKADSPRVSFEGIYDYKKVISISDGEPIMAKVWLRYWDENGFWWDSQTLDVGSV